MSVYSDMASDAGYRHGTFENRQMAEQLARESEHQYYCEQEFLKYEQELYEYEMMLATMRHECRCMWE